MRIVSISVTEASRNFADCINRARYQGTIFFLHKNGVPVARITPIEHNLKSGSELQDLGGEAKPEEVKPSERTPADASARTLRPLEIW